MIRINLICGRFTFKGVLEQMSQLEGAMAKEAAWKRLSLSLHCGENTMKLKALGPGAADLQLDMGTVTQPSLYTVSLC